MTTRIILAVICAPAGALVGFAVAFWGTFIVATVVGVDLDSPLLAIIPFLGALGGAVLVAALVIGPRRAGRV